MWGSDRYPVSWRFLGDTQSDKFRRKLGIGVGNLVWEKLFTDITH